MIPLRALFTLSLAVGALAPGLASAGWTPITSISDFPSERVRVSSPFPSVLQTHGISSSGFEESWIPRVVWGNDDAPALPPEASIIWGGNSVTFTFSGPMEAFGVTLISGELWPEADVLVTLNGYTSGGALVAGPQTVTIPAMGTEAGMNYGARFLAFSSDTPFRRVTIPLDTTQALMLDELVFKRWTEPEPSVGLPEKPRAP